MKLLAIKAVCELAEFVANKQATFTPIHVCNETMFAYGELAASLYRWRYDNMNIKHILIFTQESSLYET